MSLDRKEVAARGQNIQKALHDKVPASSLISLLKDVQKGVRPTEELLRSTLIGKTVNRCKQHSSGEVALLAAEIVSKWRREVHEQKHVNGGGSGAASPNARANGTTSPSPAKPSKPSVPLAKRTWQTDGIEKAKLNNEASRTNPIVLMYNGLCQHSSEPTAKILEKAKAIEQAAFDLPLAHHNTESNIYKDKMRSLYQNLRNKANPELKVRVLKGEIQPEQLVNMKPEELLSKQQKAEVAAIKKENMDKAMVAQEEKSVSTALQCGKCHQKKVSYSQAQTRSADEPMTTFCECLVCGNRWKFS